jgi:hypothetical protein
VAYVWCEGFDEQVASSAGGGGATTSLVNRKWADTITGTPQFDTSTPIHGAASHESPAATAAVAHYTATYGAPGFTGTLGCVLRAPSAALTSTSIILVFTGVSHNVNLMSTGTGGVCGIGVAPGGVSTQQFARLLASRLYFVTFSADCSANPHLLVVRLYDLSAGGTLVCQYSTTYATAAATIAGGRFGQVTALAPGFDIDIDSCWINDAIVSPGPMRVCTLKPNADGTHSFTTGDFQDNASANISTGSTTVNTLVSKTVPSTASFAKQVVTRSTSYLEVAFESLPAGIGTPVFVELRAAVHPVGTLNATSSIFRLNDNGTITAEATADMSTAADTLEYHKHGYQTRPSTSGAWDTASVNALRARWGYRAAQVNSPAVDTLSLAVIAPITLSPSRSIPQII